MPPQNGQATPSVDPYAEFQTPVGASATPATPAAPAAPAAPATTPASAPADPYAEFQHPAPETVTSPTGETFYHPTSDIPSPIEAAIGAGKSAAQPIATGARAISYVAPSLVSPETAQKLTQDTTPQGTAQQIGAAGEQMLELYLGEGLAKKLAGFGLIDPKTMELIEKYPKTARLVLGTTGVGAQAALHGQNVPAALAGGAIGEGAAAGLHGGTGWARNLLGYGIPEAEADIVPAAAKFQPALDVTPREVANYADKEGITLNPRMGSGATAPKIIEAVGERSVMGSKGLAHALDNSAAEYLSAVDRFADKVDPNNLGANPTVAGSNIQREVVAQRQAFKDAAQKLYEPIDTKLAGAKVDVAPIQQEWQKELADTQTIIDNAPEAIGSKIEQMLKKGANIGGDSKSLSFKDAQKLRTFFFDMGSVDSPDLPDRYHAMWTKLASDLDKQMGATAAKHGLANQWRTANAAWKDYAQAFGDRQSPIYRAMKSLDPERVANSLISSKSPNDVEIMEKLGLKDSLQALRRQVVDTIVTHHFAIGQKGLGGFSNQFLGKLFTPEELHELYVQAEIGRRFRWSMNPSGTSNVILGEQQLIHPSPSVLAVPMGAAKASMPKPAASYLPEAGKALQEKMASRVAPPAVGAAKEVWTMMFDPRSGQSYEVHPDDVQKATERGLIAIGGSTNQAPEQ